MRIALFGATGQLGRVVLDILLEHGHDVHVLVRNIHKLSRDLPDSSVVEGNVHDPKAVLRTLEMSDAVISVLGMADVSRPATDLSDGIKSILAGMRQIGLQRIVAVGGAGVLPHPEGGLRKDHDLPDFLTHVTAEHERTWKYLSSSTKQWTLVCPVFFNDDLPSKGYRVASEDLPPNSQVVMLHDLAEFIVREVELREYVSSRVGIVSDPLNEA